MKETLDFGKDNPLRLFFKICIPTTVAMLISALYIIADGIFIGKGIGGNGLAGVNIIVPIFTVVNGISMLLGFGGSTLCAIKLSKEDKKGSDDIFSQTVTTGVVFTLIITFIFIVFSRGICNMLGANQAIFDYSNVYLRAMMVFSVFNMLNLMMVFFIRLDGNPKYAMACSILGGLTNIVLDYVFIFPLKMGVFGAAIATGLGNMLAALLMIFYFIKKSKNIKFKLQRIGFSIMKEVCKIGFPGLLTQLCLSIVTFSYNLVLMDMYNEVGVSAYSIINYIHPLMILLFLGISQSMQPIVSFNHGAGLYDRVSKTLKVTLTTAISVGILSVIVGFIMNRSIVSLFLDSGYEAYSMAVNGLPIFFAGYVFLAVNMMAVAYFQCIEKPRYATVITLLRGAIFVVILLAILPRIIGINGIWLSVPIAEFLGVIVTVGMFYFNMKRFSYENSVDISTED